MIMKRITLFFISTMFILWLWQVNIIPTYAQDPIILTDDQKEYLLGLHLEYFEDPTGELTFKQVSSAEFDSQFLQSEDEVPNFNQTKSIYWVRFQIQNEAGLDKQWRSELAFDHRKSRSRLHPARAGSAESSCCPPSNAQPRFPRTQCHQTAHPDCPASARCLHADPGCSASPR